MRQQLSLNCTQFTTSPNGLALRKEQTKLTPLAATTVSRSTSPMALAEFRNTKEIERLLKTVHEKVHTNSFLSSSTINYVLSIERSVRNCCINVCKIYLQIPLQKLANTVGW
jgi:hypothetical protein